MFGFPGWIEITIILGIILLLFGKRLPGVMNSLGKSIVEFKKGANEGADSEEDSSKISPQDSPKDNQPG
ncbi:Sec-independent protein translocase subunit TatA/TatB [Gimesia panareensis]|uniref:Sec-independent protein translocase protein TatA n=1 Tax=Gimesia panareensis TaxID=2527978 RepID=A0A518A5N1_9PLAN|nr:twin-arginine translocase TatA/TatE family subunit [Gimesia panareensis]QDT27097.1 twin arginine translocase protein A [Gimesia panareensis]QDU50056.1 twin arginine translocase protein A [Gimesia panareensis]QDV16659.1 twin arginine translocase protein A [Gimesia panareensis]